MLLFGCTIFVWIARSECKTQTDTATRHRWQLCTQYYSSQVRLRTETCLQDKVSIFNHSLQDIQMNTSNKQLYNLLLLSCILAHCWREEIHDSATCIPFDLCRSFSVNAKTKSQKVVSTTNCFNLQIHILSKRTNKRDIHLFSSVNLMIHNSFIFTLWLFFPLRQDLSIYLHLPHESWSYCLLSLTPHSQQVLPIICFEFPN